MKTQQEVDSRGSILGNILEEYARRVSSDNAINKETSRLTNAHKKPKLTFEHASRIMCRRTNLQFVGGDEQTGFKYQDKVHDHISVRLSSVEGVLSVMDAMQTA